MINKSRAKINRIKDQKEIATNKKFITKEEALSTFVESKNNIDKAYDNYNKSLIDNNELLNIIKVNIAKVRVYMSCNTDVIHAEEFFQSGLTQHFLQLLDERFDH